MYTGVHEGHAISDPYKTSAMLLLSISLYKCYNNAILDSVTESGIGSHLGTISVAAPTCADDILILANSECELQSIMDIIYHHTQRDLVKINPQKSDLICYNTSSERKVNIGDCKVAEAHVQHI